MAKVLAFPVKKQLPLVVKERLNHSAKEYIEALYTASQLFGIEDSDQPEYEEIVELVAVEYAEALIKAIDEL